MIECGCSDSCCSSDALSLYTRAGDRLGVHGKHLHLESYDRMAGQDVYVFCRAERDHDVGNFFPVGHRSYDGACVTFVCPAGDDGRLCQE